MSNNQDAEDKTSTAIDIQAIMRLLPHRYPFLLLDKVLECEPGARLVALKNVTISEPFFQGHFPDRPIMPGVLILEAMAQATGILALQTMSAEAVGKDSLYYFVGIDKARFRRPVIPGDQMLIEIIERRNARGVIKATATARVEGDVAASAEVMGALRGVDD